MAESLFSALGHVTERIHHAVRAELDAWVSKKNGITIMPLSSVLPSESEDTFTAQAWEPGTAQPEVPAATHIGLAVISIPQKQAPFNIVEYQDNLQQALQVRLSISNRGPENSPECSEVPRQLSAGVVCVVACCVDGWAIALNCSGRRLENGLSCSELFYFLGRDGPAMIMSAQSDASWTLCILRQQ